MSRDRILAPIDGLVERSAVVITRRRFVRNVGAAALGAAVATTVGGGLKTFKSFGGIYFGGTHICGPSQYCNHTSRCNGYQCHQSSQSSYSRYAQATCSGTAGVTNCWGVCDTDSGGYYFCCDCCDDYNPGARSDGSAALRCSGCATTRWVCICHSQTGTC
jgi:hypothetical protein